MEILLEDLLTKIHSLNFSEPKQISDELERLILSDALTKQEVSYCSSKIFNSENNFFNFLSSNAKEKDRKYVNLRKEIYVLITDYMRLNSGFLINYLGMINDNCLMLFKKDLSQIVKEVALKPILAMIDLYDAQLLKPVLQVEKLAKILLDEIKFLRPKAGVKGIIWAILGSLSQKFPEIMNDFRIEIEEVILFNIRKMMKEGKSVEIKTLEGMFKGIRLMFDKNTYTQEEISELFAYAITGIEVIEDVRNFKIIKQCLLFLKDHFEFFKDCIIGQEKSIVEKLLILIREKNRRIKESASSCLESFVEFVSSRDSDDNQREFISWFINLIRGVMKSSIDAVEVMVCIRCYGLLSRSIVNCFGQEEMNKHFFLLMEISETKILRRMDNEVEEEEDLELKPENFKKILYRQKQLTSHIIAFAHLIGALVEINEKQAKHILSLFLLGVKTHSHIFHGYKRYLYKALVIMINSMSKHENLFKFWLKKLVRKSLNDLIDIPLALINRGDSEVFALRKSSNLIKSLLENEEWDKEAKKQFSSELVKGFVEYFENSKLAYKEMFDQEKKIYVPINHSDQHLTHRLSIIFHEIQRHEILDEELAENYRDILGVVYKMIINYPRTSSLQKMARSLFIIAERLEVKVLQNNPENVTIISRIVESLFSNLRELQNEILYDCLKTLLCTPSFLLRMDSRFIEYMKRVVVISLDVAHSQNIYLVMNIVKTLESVLVKGKIRLTRGRAEFLETVLPYFSSFLIKGTDEKNDELFHNLTVEESGMNKEKILSMIISFLGSLGSEAQYMAKGKKGEVELEVNHGDELMISLPLNDMDLELNLNKLIERSSHLAIESSDVTVQSAACELLHASMIVLIGKCSQGNQSSEDFVRSIRRSLPSIMKLATNDGSFSLLFKELVLQISRWLAHNKDEENALVSAFLARILNLAGESDKPEQRTMSLECLKQFLNYTLKVHPKVDNQSKNFRIFLRKIEGLSLHPDSFRRLAGLMSIKQLITQSTKEPHLLKLIFLDICYFFFVLVRTNDRQDEDSHTKDCKIFCEDIFNKISYVVSNQTGLFVGYKNNFNKYESIEKMAGTLQNNLFCPETNLRMFSLRLWMTITTEKRELVSTGFLRENLKFLEENFSSEKEDYEMGLKNFIAHCSTFSLLLEKNIIRVPHLENSKRFKTFKDSSPEFLQFESSMTQQNKSFKIFKMQNEALLQFLRFLGLLEGEGKSLMLTNLKPQEILDKLITNSFKNEDNKHNIVLFNRCIEIFKIDKPKFIKKYILKNKYDFLHSSCNVYEFRFDVNLLHLEKFFKTIMKLLTIQDIRLHLVDRKVAKSMVSFIRNSTVKPHPKTIARSKLFLNFLLKLDVLQEQELMVFLDPFQREADKFGNIVQSYVIESKNWLGILKELLRHCRNDYHIFPSFISLVSMLIDSGKTMEKAVELYSETFEISFLTKNPSQTKNVLNAASIVFRNASNYPKEYCLMLVEFALKGKNKQEYGFLALNFTKEFFEFYKDEGITYLFQKLKNPLNSFSVDVCPIELEESIKTNKSQDQINTTNFVQRVLSMMSDCNSIEPVELIFPVVKSKNRFKLELQSTVESIGANIENTDHFMKQCQVCLDLFEDKNLDIKFEKNIRFRVISRCFLPFLEQSKVENLSEFFIQKYKKLIGFLTDDSATDTRQRVLSVLEKTSVFKILEVLLRKIPKEIYKEKIHKMIIGESSKNNEITKKLVLLSHNAKKEEHPYNLQAQREFRDQKEAIDKVFVNYYRSAYDCLGSLLLSTQNKLSLFVKFLLVPDQKKGEKIFENLVRKNFNYNFSVETNFRTELLSEYYNSNRQDQSSTSGGNKSENTKKNSSNFAMKIADDSLFTLTISKGRIMPDDDPKYEKPKGSAQKEFLDIIREESSFEQKEDTIEGSNGAMEIEYENQDKALEIEMDIVNRLGPMRTLVRVIDFCHSNFSQEKNLNSNVPEKVIPGYLLPIFNHLNDDTKPVAIKIFLIKLIINRPQIFKPYKEFFNEFLLEYLSLDVHKKINGGIGFHYFMRDVCMTLIIWNDENSSITINSSVRRLRELAFSACKNLCMVLADRSKPIFIVNIELFQKISSLLKEHLVYDKNIIKMMLMFKKPSDPEMEIESEEQNGKKTKKENTSLDWILWRLAAMSIIEVAVIEKVHIGKPTDIENINNDSGGEDKHSNMGITMRRRNSNVFEQNIEPLVLDPVIVKMILVNMKHNLFRLKKPASRLIGNYMANLVHYEEKYQKVLKEVETKVIEADCYLDKVNTKQFSSCLSEICNMHPNFSVNSTTLDQVEGIIINESGISRAAIFNCLQEVFSKALEDQNKFDSVISRVSMCVVGSLDKILRDSDANNLKQFLVFMTSLSKLRHKRVIELLESSLGRIGDILYKTISAEDENMFFDLIVLIYENHISNKKIKKQCMRFVILGLSSKNVGIRNRFVEFLNTDERLPTTQGDRLRFVLKDMYNSDYEQYWLTTSAHLLLSLSELSRQSEKRIFDKPLTGYVDKGELVIGKKGRSFKNISQPLIPLSLISLSQTGYSQMGLSQSQPRYSISQRLSQIQQGFNLPTQSDPKQREAMLKTRLKYAYGGEKEDTNSILNDDMSAIRSIKDDESSLTKLTSKSAARSISGASFVTKKTTRYKKELGQFFKSNLFNWQQVSQVDDNKVRILNSNRVGMINKKANRYSFKKPNSMAFQGNDRIRTLREYRKGELPDIQITFIDLIAPLIILASIDPRVAQEIVVPIFISVHKESNDLIRKNNLNLLVDIIVKSKNNFQVINTVQGILYSLSFKTGDINIDSALIKKTASGSLSFSGAALLIEELLAKRIKQDKLDKEEEALSRVEGGNKMTLDNQNNRSRGAPLSFFADEQFEIKITKENLQTQDLLLNLIDLYKSMNEEDILKGLYRTLHSGDSFAIDILDMKMGKKYNFCLKNFDLLIQKEEQNDQNNTVFMEYLRQEKREALYKLNKWKPLIQSIKGDQKYEENFQPSEEFGKKLTTLKNFNPTDRMYMLKGMLTDEEFWNELKLTAESLMTNDQDKKTLVNDHPYELSLLSVSMLEFDRAKFYLEKFKAKFLSNWESVKDFSGSMTKNEVISDLLRQEELKDFLTVTKHYHVEDFDAIEDMNRYADIMKGWLAKKTNSSLDSFAYLSDCFNSRCLFTDIIKLRHKFYDDEKYHKDHINLALNFASGLLQLGYLDTSEKIVKVAYKKKNYYIPEDQSMDYDFAHLILQSKIESITRDINFISNTMDESNITVKFIESKYKKVRKVMEVWSKKKDEYESDFLKMKIDFLAIRTNTKKFKDVRDFVGPKRVGEYEDYYIGFANEILEKTEDLVERINLLSTRKEEFEKITGTQANDGAMEEEVITEADSVERAEYVDLKVNSLKEACSLIEALLRWFKEKLEDDNEKKRLVDFREKKPMLVNISTMLIKMSAQLIKMGHVDHSQIILVLDLVYQLEGEIAGVFKEEYSELPCWIFLKWLPQIMSYMNTNAYEFYLPILEKLIKKYPEPCFYALSVTIDDMVSGGETKTDGQMALEDSYTHFFSGFNTHKTFVRALEGLVHPDHRLKIWLDLISQNSKDKRMLNTLKNGMIDDIFCDVDELVGSKVGDFNRQFAMEISKYVKKYFGEGFSRIEQMDYKLIQESCKKLNGKADAYIRVKSINLSPGAYKTKLSNFSGWMAEFDINNFRKKHLRLEIPGQYNGDKEPIVDFHTKISYFLPEILVIPSIRKPKRLSMFGSDEKVYNLLVKGGEDLRLDERIEQLFGLMNNIFDKSVETSKRELEIGTFKVIPMKKFLGVMEWVKNTVSLKSIMEKEMDEGQDFLTNNAVIKRMTFMRKACSSRDVRQQHIALLNLSRKVIVKHFSDQIKLFPSDLLRKAIMTKVTNAEQFMKLRNSFIKNYATLSIGSYILGVGDRHLDNFLFDCQYGKVIPIDFGYSFGFGISLPIPELMPFRLTQNFMSIMYPITTGGIFRNCMIQAMKALKENRHIIIDSCEVFIRDPLMDWIKVAQKKKQDSAEADVSQVISDDFSWYPKEKIAIVRAKLRGENPVKVMMDEIDKTNHVKEDYHSNLKRILKGGSGRFRRGQALGVLPLAEQVDILIDMASDGDILGRAWTGWGPYA